MISKDPVDYEGGNMPRGLNILGWICTAISVVVGATIIVVEFVL